jgi:hypothetical protein
MRNAGFRAREQVNFMPVQLDAMRMPDIWSVHPLSCAYCPGRQPNFLVNRRCLLSFSARCVCDHHTFVRARIAASRIKPADRNTATALVLIVERGQSRGCNPKNSVHLPPAHQAVTAVVFLMLIALRVV